MSATRPLPLQEIKWIAPIDAATTLARSDRYCQSSKYLETRDKSLAGASIDSSFRGDNRAFPDTISGIAAPAKHHLDDQRWPFGFALSFVSVSIWRRKTLAT